MEVGRVLEVNLPYMTLRRAKQGKPHSVLEEDYDLIVLTDVSSTAFDSGTGLALGTNSFAQAVRARVVPVPLLTAMVAFAQPLPMSDTVPSL